MDYRFVGLHRWWSWRRLIGSALLAALVVAVSPTSMSSAGASGGAVFNYTDPSISVPIAISAGPDGALWFVNEGNNSIGRITTAGVVTNYTDASIGAPTGITAGPDGALWFTNSGTCSSHAPPCVHGSIGRITTSGVVTNYTDPTMHGPLQISTGPDAALWYTNFPDFPYGPGKCPPACGSIGRITTAGVVTDFTTTSPSAIDGPSGITAGPDGALWFANRFERTIGRITITGTITALSDPFTIHPDAITAGPDGALWFTTSTNTTHSVGRVTPGGVFSNYPVARCCPIGISAGPDGALWYALAAHPGGAVGRITTAGSIAGYRSPTIDAPFDTAPGPDGAVWFVNEDNNSIGRITTADSVTASPAQGRSGTALTISGAGFASGEMVAVKYLTGLLSRTSVLLCAPIAAADGTFSCTAAVPPHAGGRGTHTIKARGRTSGIVAENLVLRT
jgi:virginiamycin B lyase